MVYMRGPLLASPSRVHVPGQTSPPFINDREAVVTRGHKQNCCRGLVYSVYGAVWMHTRTKGCSILNKNVIPIYLSENTIFDFDFNCFRVKGIHFFLLGINKDEFPLRFIKPHMVEGSPSGLYTTVFSVLCYCGESFLQKIAAWQAYNASRSDAL